MPTIETQTNFWLDVELPDVVPTITPDYIWDENDNKWVPNLSGKDEDMGYLNTYKSWDAIWAAALNSAYSTPPITAKMFKCLKCDKKFCRSDSAKKHYRKKHLGEGSVDRKVWSYCTPDFSTHLKEY